MCITGGPESETVTNGSSENVGPTVKRSVRIKEREERKQQVVSDMEGVSIEWQTVKNNGFRIPLASGFYSISEL
jgi:hypothetical protein